VPPLVTAAVVALWWWPYRPAAGRGRSRNPRLAVAGGVLAFGLSLALLPVVTRHLPTAVVEAEDAYVQHLGGHPHPEPWVIERTRYRGGWVLRPREGLRIPVVADGERVELIFHLRFVRNSDWPMALAIRAGDELLAEWQPSRPNHWERFEVGPVAWPAGEFLTLEVKAPSPPEARLLNGILIDRVEFRWLDR
jgi:hypothetical protein